MPSARADKKFEMCFAAGFYAAGLFPISES